MVRRIILYSIVILFVLSIGGTAVLEKNPSLLSTAIKVVVPPPSISSVIPSPEDHFEKGMANAVWTKDGYDARNGEFVSSLRDIYPQSGAKWISMQVSFSQESETSTHVNPDGRPTLESFTEGVQAARKAGYDIFFEPLITVSGPPAAWGGQIHFSSSQQEAMWFQSWYAALKPYIISAQKNGVVQLAIGTELEWLQDHASPTLWDKLIEQARRDFSGKIIYDANWNITLSDASIPSWFKNKDLFALGVSAYIPLTNSSLPLAREEASRLWEEKAQVPLDRISEQIGKPIILSEFGYRDAADAGRTPWQSASQDPVDTEEHALLYDAALQHMMADSHIVGTFIWCWDHAQRFTLKNQPALEIIKKWYSYHGRSGNVAA